jgi:hypothetical protein
MILNELLDMLQVELSDLGIGGYRNGGIKDADLPLIIDSITLGQKALNRKFKFKRNRVMIELQDTVSRYILDPIYSLHHPNATGATIRYIVDSSSELFTDKVSSIIAVYSRLTGEKQALNASAIEYSFRSVGNVLDVPPTYTDDYIIVVYTPHLDQLDRASTDRNRIVDVPDDAIQALLYFIASRHHKAEGFDENPNAVNAFYKMYRSEVADLIKNNVFNNDNLGNTTRLLEDGWV